MKPTKEIIGLRIISISDGTQIGVVKDYIINPQEKTLEFMMVDQPTDYFGAKVIAYSDILGLGEFAMTISNPSVIQDVAQNTNVQDLLKQNIRVVGTKVLTKKGQLIGEVKELLVDEETGKIANCLFEAEGQMHEVGAEKIITLGKELLIVEAEPTIPMPKITEIGNTNKSQATESFPELTLVTDPAPTELEAGFNLFEQRQLQYFIGKKVEKDIVLDNAGILRAGDSITPEMVTNITTRSTLMEVTSHLQKN